MANTKQPSESEQNEVLPLCGVVESKTENKEVINIGGGNSGKVTALALAHLDAGVTCLTVDEAKEVGLTITKDEIEPITMPIKINDYHLSQPPPTRAERRKEARSNKRKKW